MEKTVCIIGGGASGIVSIKSCLAVGLIPTCYEASSQIGGLWNKNNTQTVPYCTVTNTSKEMSCFSDCPMPDDFPNYMPADKLMDYFDSYVKKNNLMSYVQLNSSVTHLECCESHSNCVCADCVKFHGKYWKVIITRNGTEETAYFDYLVVAIGFNREPFIPHQIEEKLKGFEGTVLHASAYRSWEKFEDKNIVVCGFGNSGGDISCELSRHASKVFLATKHAGYIFGRCSFGGVPLDVKFLKRSSTFLTPKFIRNLVLPKMCDRICNHANFGLEPVEEDPTGPNRAGVNDEIFTRISTGHVTITPEIVAIQGKKVTFSNGTSADDVDAIILATGYKRHFPFVEDDKLLGIPVDGKSLVLYKYIFPPKHSGRVAVVGATGVRGSVLPVFELQSRYVAEVFCGSVKLPTAKEMVESLEEKARYWSKIGKHVRETLKVEFIEYQDELAAEFGVKPCPWRMLFTDPVLAIRLWFGPSVPYQYRLQGRGAWDGARDAILTAEQRIWFPFRGSGLPKNTKRFQTQTILSILVIFVAIVFMLNLCSKFY